MNTIKSLTALVLVLLPLGGGDDGKTLYLTAQDKLYRMPLKIPGIRPGGDNHKLAAQR